MTADVGRLADRLGIAADRLAAFETYDQGRIDELEAIVARAMEAEDQAFDQALDDALRFVPKLLRGPAQKLLFPGGRRG